MNSDVHLRTPSLTVNNGCGWPVRQIAYLRTVADETPVALVSRQQHDVAGRIIEQWDARLPHPNLTSVYGLAGAPLKVDSVDAGWRLNLPGLAGEILERRDERGSLWRTTYDEQLRVVAVEENAQPNVETFSYADGLADAGQNLRGRLLSHMDQSGGLAMHSYGLAGSTLHDTRTFHDAQAFSSARTFGPLGPVLEQTDAGGHRQQSHYDLAGQLSHVALKIDAATDWQPVLIEAQYNAAGQIILQQTGNGVTSRWHYDSANGRLHRQSATSQQSATLQDFEYAYDRVGNLTRILDHVFTPSYFANQRIDGHREFSYDSLYRLSSASGYDDAAPTDHPGRPEPGNPADRRNYLQTYAYDSGGNLIELRHVRADANLTQRMSIDPNSNRAVRSNELDPQPDFDTLFDRHGNLLTLQPGHPMTWSARDQLTDVTLVKRDNDPDDQEHYRYSQGGRVYKRHDFDSNKHFHEVRYLPGLEIRRKDNGEELHVISVGNARCLHWAASPPSGIPQNQLRYTLEDHLGSCLLELDQLAQTISHEGYYPFGATAWMTARSLIEVAYKFIRYSGKEMDVSGLYYYGARYYAPWVQRWVSADPLGAVDGLNLYAFVGNNPLRYVDAGGGSKAEADIRLSSDFITAVGEFADHTNRVMHNVINQKHLVRNLLANTGVEVIKGAAGTVAGFYSAQVVDSLVPSVPGVPYLGTGGLIAGNFAGDMVNKALDPLANFAASKTGLTLGPLIPQTSTMSVAKINSKLGIKEQAKDITSVSDFTEQVINPALNAVLNPDFMMNRVMSSWLSIIPATLSTFQRAIEVEDIKVGLDPVKMNKIEAMYTDWQQAVGEHADNYEAAFTALGTDVLASSGTGKGSISLASLRQQTQAVQANISQGLAGLAAYRQMNTTDNRYLRAQAHPQNKVHSRLYNWWTHENKM
jgi:insecticidal toxin complex protein TccC